MEYKLSEIFDLQMGKTPDRKNSNYWSGATEPWISIADLSKCDKYIDNTAECISEQAVEDSGIKIIPKNTVIMSFKLSIGKLAITPKEMYSNEAIMAFVDKGIAKIEPTYLYYLLMNKEWNEGTNKAVMGRTLNKATLSDIKIRIHKHEEQLDIINVLDKIQPIISDKKRQLEQLDILIKARFIEMFGEPGQDDKGWGLTTLDECCELNPKRPRNIGDELMVSFVPMHAVSEDGKFDCSDVRPYKEVRKGFTYFAENDVLFAKITPCMENGKGAVARGLEGGIASGSTEFHVLRPIRGKTNPYWIYILTLLDSFRIGARKVMTGTGGQLRVPINYLKEYSISLPPIDLQDTFEEFVQQVDKSKVV